MKKLSLLLGFSLAATSLLASAPHPSVLTVKVKDEMLPVVKVIGTDPVVLAGGQEKRIRTDPIYLIQRTDAFGAGFIHVRRASLGGSEIKVVASPADAQIGGPAAPDGPHFGTSYFESSVTAKQTVSGGFIAIVIYSPINLNSNATAKNHSEVIVHDLPVLPAGQEVTVQITAAIANDQPNQRYFIQFFDADGRELVTDHLETAWQYYATRDRVQLKGVVDRYLEKFKGADHAAVPAITPRPVFVNVLPPPAGAATALLAVSAEGQVTSVTVSGVEEGAARQSISSALGGWLFLPQLKGGQPVATKIKVPLQF
jgi:hypothetical protein